MDEGVDSGDIVSQVVVSIDETDDAAALYAKITDVAIQQIEDFVPKLASGNICKQPQDLKLGNIWRKRYPADGKIDWRMSSQTIHNLVKGLAKPYIGAHFDYENQSIKVWKTALESPHSSNLEPGKILAVDEMGVIVKTGDGAIRLLSFEPKIELTLGGYL
jgi:methionyl-tRNA formyltransferase